jgi:hypothetical protein
VATSLTVSDAENNIIRVPRLWIERNAVIEVERIDSRNQPKPNCFDVMSVSIPDEIRAFFKERQELLDEIPAW